MMSLANLIRNELEAEEQMRTFLTHIQRPPSRQRM